MGISKYGCVNYFFVIDDYIIHYPNTFDSYDELIKNIITVLNKSDYQISDNSTIFVNFDLGVISAEYAIKFTNLKSDDGYKYSKIFKDTNEYSIVSILADQDRYELYVYYKEWFDKLNYKLDSIRTQYYIMILNGDNIEIEKYNNK